MGTLKHRGGHLLAKNGHLCLSCCEDDLCSGPTCVNFATLFPMYYPYSIAPPCQPQIIKVKWISNPLAVSGELVVSSPAHFDDDLQVNDEPTIGGECTYPIDLPVGFVITSGVPAGAQVKLTLWDNWGVYCFGTGCACWRPTTLSSFVDVAQARFALCKSCSESLQDGFGCRLVEGCCFGRKRSTPNFSCPKGSW